MANFQLMNGNNIIADLNIINNYVYIEKLYKDLPSFLENINEWISKRSTIFGRQNIINLAKLAGIDSTEDFVKIAKAISVTDTIWINDIQKPISWEKINPYKNRISTILANIAIDGYDLEFSSRLDSPSPQYRISGSVDKCVKRHNNRLYLYKTDGGCWSDLAGKRPYSEYFVSQLEKILGFNNYTTYTIHEYEAFDETIKKNIIKPYCRCEFFTNEKYGLVECEHTIFRTKTIRELANLFRNSKRDINILREMMLLDSITLNIDRHTGNYGFIIDNNNFQILGLAPIYDNDCALGALESIQNKSFNDVYTYIKNNKRPKVSIGDYDELALTVMNGKWYNRLKSIGTINLTKGNLKGISQTRVDFMNYI
ncbi:hypothetical protein IJJ97_02815, partial [bacterium]|nr:hypothetical protein [bacterium]